MHHSMRVGRVVKVGLLLTRGATLVGYLFFWAVVLIFGYGPDRSPFYFLFLYLIFASGFLGATALSISLKAVNLRWPTFVWYLSVTMVPLIVSFVRNIRPR
jgi:hypothetical protein